MAHNNHREDVDKHLEVKNSTIIADQVKKIIAFATRQDSNLRKCSQCRSNAAKCLIIYFRKTQKFDEGLLPVSGARDDIHIAGLVLEQEG